MATYRALISVPIEADSDHDAAAQAYGFAQVLTHPGGRVIAGHVELVTESSGLTPVRVVMEDDSLREQIPSPVMTHKDTHR